MEIKLICEHTQTIKELIYEKVSRNFYGHLKSHDVKYFINNTPAESFHTINSGNELKIIYTDEDKKTGLFSDKALCVVYEDSNYIVIDKEAHLQTIPSASNPYDSVYNRLLSYFKETHNTIHVVNRLDKETKGLVLVAKNKIARALLAEWDKTYIATTSTPLEKNSGVFLDHIKRCDEGIKRMVDPEGELACTCYELIEQDLVLKKYTYAIKLRTGKTHQIRVHFSFHNAPLIGDTLYGGVENPELLLCCKYLSFTNPFTKEQVSLTSRY